MKKKHANISAELHLNEENVQFQIKTRWGKRRKKQVKVLFGLYAAYILLVHMPGEWCWMKKHQSPLLYRGEPMHNGFGSACICAHYEIYEPL